MKYIAVFFDWGDTLSCGIDDWVPGLVKKLYRYCYRLAVISNTHRYQDGWNIRNELARRDILPCFEVVISSATYAKHKPDPLIFHKALGFMQIQDASKVVMVGDRENADGGCRPMGMSYLKVVENENWSGRLLAELDDPMPKNRKLSNVYEYENTGDSIVARVRHLSESIEVGDHILVNDNEMTVTSLSRPVSKTDVLLDNRECVKIGVRKT